MTNVMWSASTEDTVPFDGQNLTIGFSDDPTDPIGTIHIRGEGFVSTPLDLPNSSQATPTWNDIPGTEPVLQARQDGHFPQNLILVRYRNDDIAGLRSEIGESGTVVFNRPTLVDPPSAADMFQWTYEGNRVAYINEFACFRARGLDQVQTVARFMSHVNRDGTALPIFQVSLSNAATHLFEVRADGSILASGALSMLPTAPVAVTYVAAGAANAALINDGNVLNTGAPYPVTTTLEAANRRVHLDGSMANTSGVSIPAQTTLFTVDPAHRPTAWEQFTVRTSNNLACRVTVKGATGAVCLDQALAAGATVSFGGANWRKS